MEAKIKRPTVIVSAVVTRADGTIEDLGEISRTEPKIEEEKDDGRRS
jgi:hypothetical protein